MPDARVTILLETKDQASAALQRVKGNLTDLSMTSSGAGQAMESFGGQIAPTFAALGRLAGPVAAGVAIGTMAKAGVGLNIQLEQATLTYKTLLGSAEAANQRIAELRNFANVTPFRFEDVLQADRLLQTFGARSMETLTLVGDAAAGTGQNFNEVAFWIGRAYSAIQAGQPFGEAAMRLQEMGILTGTARQEIEKLATPTEKWAELQQQLAKYQGLMAEQSQTLGGQLSTLLDEFQSLSADLTAGFIPVLKEIVAFSIDAVAAVGFLKDEAGKFLDGPAGGLIDFAGDLVDKINDVPGPIKLLGATLAAGAAPALAFTVGVKKGVDMLSDLADSSEDAGRSMASATVDIKQFNRGVSESNSRLWQAPMAAKAVHDSIVEVAEKWRDAKQAAEDAATAFFDALNVPTVERQQRETALAQAEYNAGILQQQIDAGQGLMPSSQKGMTKQQYLDFLINNFIPAQREWIKLDELNIKRLEEGGKLSMQQTGNVKDYARALDGQLTPGFHDLNSAVYDTNDAMRGLGDTTPTDLRVTLDGPTPTVANKASEIRRDFRGEGTVPVDLGWNDPPKTPNQIINELQADATETVKVGMQWSNPRQPQSNDGILKSPNAVIASLQADASETVKVGMEWEHARRPRKPDGSLQSPNDIIASLDVDASETVKVGMEWQNPRRPQTPGKDGVLKSPNAVIASLQADTSETVKAGMEWLNPTTPYVNEKPKTPNQIIAELQAATDEQVKVGMSVNPPSNEALNALVIQVRDNILWLWKQLTGSGKGVTFTPTMLQAAQAIKSSGWRPHNEQGMVPTSPSAPPIVVNVNVSGPVFSTETALTQAARALVPALRRELDRAFA